jgi:hypothetical protein
MATLVFALAYTLSSLYIGPLLTGETTSQPELSSVTTTNHDHDH